MSNTLKGVVDLARYKPGWTLSLRNWNDWPHLHIQANVLDSNPPHGPLAIGHVQPVPLLSDEFWTEAFSQQWVRDRVLAVERHEVGEWLRFGDERPFLPYHGEEGDPYA